MSLKNFTWQITAHGVRHILFTLLTSLGLLVSSYLLLLKWGFFPCIGNCNHVANSALGSIFGIPLAAFGIIFWLILWVIKVEYLKYCLIIGSLSSLYFVYYQAFILHSYCLFCCIHAGIVWSMWTCKRPKFSWSILSVFLASIALSLTYLSFVSTKKINSAELANITYTWVTKEPKSILILNLSCDSCREKMRSWLTVESLPKIGLIFRTYQEDEELTAKFIQTIAKNGANEESFLNAILLLESNNLTDSVNEDTLEKLRNSNQILDKHNLVQTPQFIVLE